MAFNTVSFHKNISDFDFFSCEREAEHHIFSMGRDLDEYCVVELKSFDATVRGIIYGVDEYRWYNTISPDLLRRENGIEMNEKVYEYHKKQLRSRAFKLMIANHELINIRKRTRNGIRTALQSGRFVNKAPHGFYWKAFEMINGKPK
ncbi:hypothetical protein [Chitinophaga polysaccharea]|uniref:hypothetical protein n=1 Tax=Chitinophaga polysaccharea TaxID=1293035 RepID=UPI00115BDCE5|nr:hypothetical protein [Chitinophaga polysaccharea]